MLGRNIIIGCVLLAGGCAAEINVAKDPDRFEHNASDSGKEAGITDQVAEGSRKKREQYAREVSLQFKEGTAPTIPALYEGKYTYSPQANIIYDECRITVIEYNDSREVSDTFFINVCTTDK